MDLQAESPLSEKRPKHPCLVCFIISQSRLLHLTGTELKAVDLAQRSTYCHFLWLLVSRHLSHSRPQVSPLDPFGWWCWCSVIQNVSEPTLSFVQSLRFGWCSDCLQSQGRLGSPETRSEKGVVCACHVLVMCLSCANLCTLNLTWNLCCPKALKDLRKNTQVTQKLLWTSVNCTFLKQRCNGTLSEALQGHVPHSGWGCRIELHRRRYQHGYPCSNQTVTDYLTDSNLHKSATLAAPWPNLLRLSGFHEIGFVKRMSKNVKEQNSVIFRRKTENGPFGLDDSLQ